ncbi:hypothetical protein TNCV_4334511 [Trichonephila clavipes]|nr:hypothetical protein TNCV_4334511 [Trichonephila clavipes]
MIENLVASSESLRTTGRSKRGDRDRIQTRADCFGKRKKREERPFTCWPDRDEENERSLLDDLVMLRNCVEPPPPERK